MTGELALAAGMALWLGILTSISPCPLATNIAAISYIARRVDVARAALLSGLLYTAGRMLAYVVVGVIISASLLSMPEVSRWLQTSLNRFLGPLLILVGMFLLELIQLPMGTGKGWSEALRGRAEGMGIWGAGLLGILFALSFCPVSAALFFGSLLPLAITSESPVLLPAVFGLGTALPVFVFALVIAFGAQGLSRAFSRVSAFDKWARWTTGVIFILIGLYLTVLHVFLL
jgi:cytochrome c-type biogenesis protein